MDVTEQRRRAAFSVVSGTTLRFVSLVAAVLGTSIYAFSVLYATVPANGRNGVLAYARCDELFQRHAPPPDLDLLSFANANEQALQDLSQCLAPFEQTQAAWLFAGLGVLLAVAAALYLLTPSWTRWRGRLVPLTTAEFPQLRTALTELCALAGLRRAPEFVLDPVAAAPGGLTFGRFGRYTVRLNAGLVPLRLTDPAMFRAIVLHELAHIRNRDVDIAYAAVALWRSFVAVALLPLAVAIVYPTILYDPPTPPWSNPDYGQWVLNVSGRTLLFVIVVYLSRNAVLRTRETYADAQAAGFSAADGLRRAVAATGVRPTRRWRRWIEVHPDPNTRLRAIEDPVVLIRPSFGEMFGAGLTTMIAATTIVYYAGLALPHTGIAPGRTVAWMIAPIAAGMLGAVAWRAEVMSVLSRTRVSVLPAALGFSLGWLLGDLLSLTSAPGMWGVFGTRFSAGQLALTDAQHFGGISVSAGVAGALLLTVGMFCQAAVSAAGARCWLPVLRGRTTRWAWAAGALVTMIPFAVWFGIWAELRSAPYLVAHLYHATAADVASFGVELWKGPGVKQLATFYPPLTIFQGRALAIPAVALAWLYPLAAWLRRGPGIGERTGQVTPPLSRPVLSLRFAVITGCAGTGAFAVIVLAARAALHHYVPDRAGAADFSLYFFYCLVALVVMIQAIAGGLVAARIRPLGLLLGQVAAFVCAVASTALALGAGVLGGCVPAFRLRANSCSFDVDAGYAMTLLKYVVIEGALAALIVGAVVRMVAEVASRLPQGLRPRSPLVRSLAFVSAVLVLIVAGSMAAATTYGSGDGANVAASRLVALRSVASSAPPASASGPDEGSRGRILTEAEATTVARAVASGLPQYWRDKQAEPASDDTNVDPQACESIADNAYLKDLDSEKRASARVSLTNGGKLAVSLLNVTVTSYAIPVPASVFAAAEAARAACPRFTATTGDGFQVNLEVTAGSAPHLGEQAWRVNLGMSSKGLGVETIGIQSTVMVRVGHSLITVTMSAFGEPIDETLFLEALTRVVKAVP